ncbi:MAG: archease, partial [Anaerolineae bacterium]|nr:archease [Anaerolineae bacterium]
SAGRRDMGRYQEIEHTADLALHLWATDLPDLFATAAQGMLSLFVEVDDAAPVETAELTLTALDVETLLIDWLNELLYFVEVQGIAFTMFEFTELTLTALAATLRGGPVWTYTGYVKAATFHDLSVLATPAGYETEIVFDT